MNHDYLHTDKFKPNITEIHTIAQTQVFEIQAVNLVFTNGEQRIYERLTPARRPAVMVLAIEQGHLMMIREYAVGTERYELTCVKGLIDEGETPEQAANRELQEEIGLKANQLTPLRSLYTSPSHMYSPMYVFVAEGLTPSRLLGDEPEPLEVVRIPLCDLDKIIDNEDFGDARVLAALLLMQRSGKWAA